MLQTFIILKYLVLYDVSQLLNTGLDRETLVTCVGMIESGVNPEALAVSIRRDIYTRLPSHISLDSSALKHMPLSLRPAGISPGTYVQIC